ncbi:MAG: hypothetical protein H6814_09060 [Phycisphaeraceae bacterium]|nr:hypothetical protein [Phycisphaeraceae bacterium]
MTDDEFRELVFTHVDRHLTEMNIQPARLRWEGDPDVPADPKDAPVFVKGCLRQTGMDISLIEPEATGGTYYCFDGLHLYCYSELSLKWTGPGIESPVTARVPVGKGVSVPVPLSCMLTIYQYRSEW